MASTDSTTKSNQDKSSQKDISEPTVVMRKYFLPETGEVIEAASATEAAKLSSKAKKGNEG